MCSYTVPSTLVVKQISCAKLQCEGVYPASPMQRLPIFCSGCNIEKLRVDFGYEAMVYVNVEYVEDTWGKLGV